MRFIIYGAGAIGGVIGARLHAAGQETVLIARGAHLDAVRQRGLRLLTPDEEFVVRPHTASAPSEIAFGDGDVVLLCVKSQDTLGALDALRAAAGDDIPVLCAQNGVANERMALRRFQHVYGTLVMMPATHLEPGVVQADSAPTHGMLDIGCFPSGTDDLAGEVAAVLRECHFHTRAIDDIMPWKYAKLLSNLSNVVDALCGTGADTAGIVGRAREEAEQCLRAAGIPWVGHAEYMARRADHVRVRPVTGGQRAGGSSWQSIRRGTHSIETDYLNGEICLLGRLHGVPTPVNRVLQREAERLAASGALVGSMPLAALEQRLTAAVSVAQ